MSGIVLADSQAWRPGWILFLITLLVWLPVWRRPRLWMALPGIVLAFAMLHSLRLKDTFAHPLRQHLLTLPDRPVAVEILGHLYPWTEGAELDEAAAMCEVTHLRWGNAGAYLPMNAKVKVRLPIGYALKSPGHYEIQGSVSLPKPPMNPGQFDAVTYGLRMGWIALLDAREINLKTPDTSAVRFHLLFAAEAARQWMTQVLTHGLENEDRHAAVILAMALGTSDAAGEDIEDAFRDSGTLHIFAVSGLHVVMLAYIATWCLRWMGTQRLTYFLIFLMFAYAFITGWRPSAARAAFMMSIVLAAPIMHRKSQLPNTLGAAALILLTLDSHQLFLPGFQLSFGVLLAIALLATWLMMKTKPWCELDLFLPPVLATRLQRFGVGLRTSISSLVCVSAAAWLGSLPFMIGHFQTITPVAVISNLVLVPASELCLALSCASLLLATFQWSWAVILVNQLNAWLAKWMVITAGWFAQLPFANQTLDLRFYQEPPSAEMRVFHVSRGGGATYLRSGEKRWFLDTGNERNWRYVLRPFLRQSGINQLDGLVLSHSDISHIGAVPLVMAAQKVPHIHTSKLEPWRLDPPFASLKQLGQMIQPDGPVWRRHRIDDVIILGTASEITVLAQVLHPSGSDLHEKANDRGLVLLIKIGSFRVLWLNDAGFITEKRLLQRHADVRCDILIRNQHNADVSGLTELLLAAQPQAIISSNDSYLAEERLPQRIRDFCEVSQIPLFDLEVSGSVGLEFRNLHAELRAFRSGQSVTLQPKHTGSY